MKKIEKLNPKAISAKMQIKMILLYLNNKQASLDEKTKEHVFLMQFIQELKLFIQTIENGRKN